MWWQRKGLEVVFKLMWGKGMWDIFSKKSLKVEVQNLENKLRDKNSKLKKLNDEIQALNDNMVGLQAANQTLTEEVELNQKSLDLVLAEVKEFLIHNKDQNLNYDTLDLTSQLIEDFADLIEYVIIINIDLREFSAKVMKRKFEIYLSDLQTIKSFRFSVNQAIKRGGLTETYLAAVYIYSINEFQTIINEILAFLYKRRVRIVSDEIKHDKLITIKGTIR